MNPREIYLLLQTRLPEMPSCHFLFHHHLQFLLSPENALYGQDGLSLAESFTTGHLLVKTILKIWLHLLYHIKLHFMVGESYENRIHPQEASRIHCPTSPLVQEPAAAPATGSPYLAISSKKTRLLSDFHILPSSAYPGDHTDLVS